MLSHISYSDCIHEVSNIYYTTDWHEGDNVKTEWLSCHIVEFEVIEEWATDSVYEYLIPDLSCDECGSSEVCDYGTGCGYIDGAGLIDKTATWIDRWKDTDTFDDVMIVHEMSMTAPSSSGVTIGW